MVCGAAHAQSAQPQTEPHALPQALMISDLHFDPFYDPAKVSQLAAAPVSGWETILAGPDSPAQAKDYAALLKTCKAKGPDTSYPLLVSALSAIRKDAGDVRFITVSGDLMAHDFSCRFTNTLPQGTKAQFDALAEKTIEFQAREIEKTLPHATLYLSLGNNDSNCGDYKLDTGTPFLAAMEKVVGHGIGAGWGAAASASFTNGGYYSVTMAAPMQRTRLIVVNDIFLGKTYTTCGGKADTAPAEAQMKWLQQQLDAARQLHQRVWVMGHIPPGINPYSTLKHGPDAFCAASVKPGSGPSMFMANESLGDTLAKNADVIKLAIFAHTHMDELRLLGPEGAGVAVKLVPSISPVDGNLPSFTVAQVDPVSATLTDYTVFNSQDALGSAWAKEYSFAATYGHTGFTPETLRAVIEAFRADADGSTPESQAYMRFYPSSAPTGELSLLWPGYVCALTHTHPADYTSCVCGGH
jgi:sphingomyelin phosphodiesterase acid-like 3